MSVFWPKYTQHFCKWYPPLRTTLMPPHSCEGAHRQAEEGKWRCWGGGFLGRPYCWSRSLAKHGYKTIKAENRIGAEFRLLQKLGRSDKIAGKVAGRKRPKFGTTTRGLQKRQQQRRASSSKCVPWLLTIKQKLYFKT